MTKKYERWFIFRLYHLFEPEQQVISCWCCLRTDQARTDTKTNVFFFPFQFQYHFFRYRWNLNMIFDAGLELRSGWKNQALARPDSFKLCPKPNRPELALGCTGPKPTKPELLYSFFIFNFLIINYRIRAALFCCLSVPLALSLLAFSQKHAFLSSLALSLAVRQPISIESPPTPSTWLTWCWCCWVG